MTVSWDSLAALLILNGLISALIAVRSWLRRKRPGQAAFAGLMCSISVYAVGYGLETAARTLEGKTFWIILENPAIVCIGPFWLLFTLGYAQKAWATKERVIMLFIIPAVTLLWFAAGLWKTMYYVSPTPATASGGPLIFERGPWYWVQMIYTYSLLIIGTVVLIRAALRMPDIYRGQVAILLIGLAVPWLTNGYYLLSPLVFPAYQLPIDPTPVAFSAIGILYSVGVFGFRLFDLVPVARTAVFEHIPELVIVLDEKDLIVDINATARAWLELDYHSAIGRGAALLFRRWPDLYQRFENVGETYEEVHIHGNPPRELELTILPLKDMRGRLVGRLIMGRDITLSKQIDKQLHLQIAALDAAANEIVITDTTGTCIWVNPAFTRVSGYRADEIIGRKQSILKSGAQDDKFYKDLWETILAGQTWSGEIVNKHKEGHLYIEEMTIAPVRNADGEITNFIAIKQDITERKRIENNLQEAYRRLEAHVQEIEILQTQLREQAIRDPLTGLFNRRYLEETMERETARALREAHDLCVAMIDVDHFKNFNDFYGHKVGDAILQSLGAMLLGNTRLGDIACRYGGEEFIVIMPGASLEDAHKRADQWREKFKNQQTSITKWGMVVTISIGLAIFPLHGKDSDAMLDAADQALYQAKALGRNQVAVFSPDRKNPYSIS